jgi:hypothetical protein
MRRIAGVAAMDKTAFLKMLTPYYVQAEEQDKLDTFFDTLFTIWLDRYPIDEFCDPAFHGDQEYYEWAATHIKAVSFTILYLNVFLL